MKTLLLSDFHFCKSTEYDRVICMANSIVDVINNQIRNELISQGLDSDDEDIKAMTLDDFEENKD